MHLANHPDFEYLPGETVILPAKQSMVIDFPESTHSNPTQCIALTVNSEYVQNTMQYLNTCYNSDSDDNHEWNIDFSQYHFSNDTEIAETINKIIRNCSSGDKAKNIYTDLSLKELLIRLVQSQYLKRVEMDKDDKRNSSRQHFLLDYIHGHLTEKLGVDALSRKAYMSRNEFFKWFRHAVRDFTTGIYQPRTHQTRQTASEPVKIKQSRRPPISVDSPMSIILCVSSKNLRVLRLAHLRNSCIRIPWY